MQENFSKPWKVKIQLENNLYNTKNKFSKNKNA